MTVGVDKKLSLMLLLLLLLLSLLLLLLLLPLPLLLLLLLLLLLKGKLSRCHKQLVKCRHSVCFWCMVVEVDKKIRSGHFTESPYRRERRPERTA